MLTIARSPLRLSLGGGGTDLPSFYRRFGGGLVASAIDKYVFIVGCKTFFSGVKVRYSNNEEVDTISQIQHSLFRATLEEFYTGQPRNLELISAADIPAGTGLGSSSAFSTALLRALFSLNNKTCTPEMVASTACKIEIDILGSNIGKQDQYISAYGGLQYLYFNQDDTVTVKPIEISSSDLDKLSRNLALFFTGYSRSADVILTEQDTRTREGDSKMIEQLKQTYEVGLQTRDYLETGRFKDFAELMTDHWRRKVSVMPSVSNERINALFDLALRSGAVGGKLIGAGGGGFLLLYASDLEKLIYEMEKNGATYTPFSFDFEGTRLV